MITSAKGLANGFPMGATLCRDWIAEEYGQPRLHFQRRPCRFPAAANATVQTIVEEDVPAHAESVGNYLQERLADELGDDVREVRGGGADGRRRGETGAMRYLKQLAMNHQILALPAGRTVVRLLPPLTITEDQADEVVAAMAEVIG